MREQIFFDDPSLTKQAFKDECDINRIMRRWLKDGVVTHLSSAAAVYRDVSSDIDYQVVMNQVIDLQDSFMNLPSNIRKRFSNDPLNLLDFIQDPDNAKEAVELGLVSAPEVADLAVKESPPAAPES
jgi:phage internal scaffolding protein